MTKKLILLKSPKPGETKEEFTARCVKELKKKGYFKKVKGLSKNKKSITQEAKK